jgi:hypothetical protein
MTALFTTTACLLVALCFTLTPMAPGGQVDTRDFSALPRWQFNSFNVFLISLGIASLVASGFAIAEVPGSLVAALILGVLYAAVFALDLGRIFPVVKDALPPQLLVLEVLSLALAGVVVTLAIKGMLT